MARATTKAITQTMYAEKGGRDPFSHQIQRNVERLFSPDRLDARQNANWLNAIVSLQSIGISVVHSERKYWGQMLFINDNYIFK